MRKIKTLFVVAFAIAFFATLARTQDFDKPIGEQVVDFGPAPYYGPPYYTKENAPHIELSCYFYDNVAIKQYDEKQKGAAWLSIAPNDKRRPVECAKTNGPGEKVIKYPEWSGYFLGVKGKLVFFREADGMNGVIPFAVFDAKTQQKIFEDSFFDSTFWSVRFEPSPFNHLRVYESPDGQTRLLYLRGGEADCDLPMKGDACWQKIRKKFNLVQTRIPRCSGYDEPEIKAYRPYLSAIVYPVEVTLFPKPTTKAIAGPVKCWPVD